MKKLRKHKLNSNRVKLYLNENLHETNLLSDELLNLINFERGTFYTLLPNDANIDRIYEFNVEGILPQNPIEEYIVSGKKSTYSIIPTIREELSEWILNEIKNKKLQCIFDDVTRRPTDKNNKLLHSIGLFYEDQVYYFINKTNASIDLIMQCLNSSNAFWHSLCILTKADFKKAGNCKIGLNEIKNICLNTVVIIVGAYDSEGYVFWEKENRH